MSALGAYRHNGDHALLESLGLRTGPFNPEWTDLGTVVLAAAHLDGNFGPKPATTVKVEVMALPAQAWRFTIERPRDEIEDIAPEAPLVPFERRDRDGRRWRAVYEPAERFVITTGTGGFGEYWSIALAIARNMVNVERIDGVAR